MLKMIDGSFDGFQVVFFICVVSAFGVMILVGLMMIAMIVFFIIS